MNLSRDPHEGHNEDGYSEDPHTGRPTTAYGRGALAARARIRSTASTCAGTAATVWPFADHDDGCGRGSDLPIRLAWPRRRGQAPEL